MKPHRKKLGNLIFPALGKEKYALRIQHVRAYILHADLYFSLLEEAQKIDQYETCKGPRLEFRSQPGLKRPLTRKRY